MVVATVVVKAMDKDCSRRPLRSIAEVRNDLGQSRIVGGGAGMATCDKQSEAGRGGEGAEQETKECACVYVRACVDSEKG